VPHAIRDKKKREEEERLRQTAQISQEAERVEWMRKDGRERRRQKLAETKLAALLREDLARLRTEAETFESVAYVTRIAPKNREDEIHQVICSLALERHATVEEIAACEPPTHQPD
jgi:hypothetical protein